MRQNKNRLDKLIQQKYKYYSFQFIEDFLDDVFEKVIPDEVKERLIKEVIKIKLKNNDIFD